MNASGYPFHSAYPNRLWAWFGPFDHRVIGRGRSARGLLHQPEEELAAAFRRPAIEAKREFIQVIRQMPRCHRALVRTQYPPLQERGNPVYTRQQLGRFLPASPQSRDLPLVAFGLQARVALPAVGVNRAAWIDAILHKRVQAGSRGVLNHAHPNPSYTRPISLGGDHNQSLTLGLPTRHAFLQPANHGLVYLHPAAQDRKSTRLNSSHRCISYAVF